LDSEGSRLIAGSLNGAIDVWDLNNKNLLFSLNGGSESIIEIFFDQGGRNFWSMEQSGEIFVWDSETGEKKYQQQRDRSAISDGEWNPSSRYSAYSSWNGTTTVYEHKSKFEPEKPSTPMYTLRGHAGRVTGVAINPDGTILATSGVDGTVRLWDMATGEQILTLTGHSLAVTGVDFSPDGRYLVASGSDGTVRVYVLANDELIALARSRVSRGLTREECQRYLHVDRCPDS
jgi:WD40 repeat protein